jgi:hypothetical protein
VDLGDRRGGDLCRAQHRFLVSDRFCRGAEGTRERSKGREKVYAWFGNSNLVFHWRAAHRLRRHDFWLRRRGVDHGELSGGLAALGVFYVVKFRPGPTGK